MELKNYYEVEGYFDCDETPCVSAVQNCKVYGLLDSVIASGYPMQTIIDNSLTQRDVARITSLGSTSIGTGHDNFLNGIIVQFDLTFSNKAWVELQRYHFIDFVSSQSTIHKLSKFNIEDSCNTYVDERIIDILNDLQNKYNETKDKEDYLSLLYSNPSGFMLTARMSTNYRQLKTIWHQRKNHPLYDWKEFCKWIVTLPFMQNILGGIPVREEDIHN